MVLRKYFEGKGKSKFLPKLTFIILVLSVPVAIFYIVGSSIDFNITHQSMERKPKPIEYRRNMAKNMSKLTSINSQNERRVKIVTMQTTSERTNSDEGKQAVSMMAHTIPGATTSDIVSGRSTRFKKITTPIVQTTMSNTRYGAQGTAYALRNSKSATSYKSTVQSSTVVWKMKTNSKNAVGDTKMIQNRNSEINKSAIEDERFESKTLSNATVSMDDKTKGKENLVSSSTITYGAMETTQHHHLYNTTDRTTLSSARIVNTTRTTDTETCIDTYPLNIDMVDLAQRILKGDPVRVPVINDHPFDYIHSPDALCSSYDNQKRLRLLILVKSAVFYFDIRRTIRSTWGKEVRKLGIEYAFLLGFSLQLQPHIDKEEVDFRDIIQETFIDDYRNNTYKTIMAYNWVVKYCPVAERVLFLDDDVLLNAKILNMYLRNLDALGVKTLYSGKCAVTRIPNRNRNLYGNFISPGEYPCSLFPQYLSGFASILSIDVVKTFQAVFPYVKYIFIDDVYLGIVARKLNIQPTENQYFKTEISNAYELLFLIATHGFRNSNLYLHAYKELAKFGTT